MTPDKKPQTMWDAIEQIHTETLEIACLRVQEHYRKWEMYKRIMAGGTAVAAAFALVAVNGDWVLPFSLGAFCYALMRR